MQKHVHTDTWIHMVPTRRCEVSVIFWNHLTLFFLSSHISPSPSPFSHFIPSSTHSLYLLEAFSVLSLFQICEIPVPFFKFFLPLTTVLFHMLSLFLSFPLSWQKSSHTHKFKGMSGMRSFLQHHVVVIHMTATPEPEECECFSRAHR